MVSRDNLMFSLGQTIDIRDYINGIENCSCEPYIRVCTLCCSLHPVANQKFANKMAENCYSCGLIDQNSKTEIVSSFK